MKNTIKSFNLEQLLNKQLIVTTTSNYTCAKDCSKCLCYRCCPTSIKAYEKWSNRL